jgi:hypothetical protein
MDKPFIGMGATICLGTDRLPATIIKISASGKQITLQEDNAFRKDENGMSEVQKWIFTSNNNGQVYSASLRKDGRYRLAETNMMITLGIRRKYFDYCF